MQQEQFFVQFDFVVGVNATPPTPAFSIQALTPWNNVSASGYDRSIMIRGIVFDMNCVLLAHDSGSGETPGPFQGSARAFAVLASNWFVDAADGAQAPTSFLQAPYGPFQNTPPIVAPGAGPPDSNVLPTRILKRKMKQVVAGVISPTPPTTVRAEAAWDAGSLSQFNWSGTIRKRFACDDRQGLYWGIYGLTPFAVDIDLFYTVRIGGTIYYTLRR